MTPFPTRYPPAPFDWNSEMENLEAEHMLRLDDHLTDEQTAERLAQIDRLTAPLHRERPWQSVLGLIGSGTIALLFVALVAMVLL